jgi:hypothetical protein
MVSVKLLVGRAGVTEKGVPFSQSVGRIVDVSAAEAERMVAAGQAEMVQAKRGRPRKATESSKDLETR